MTDDAAPPAKPPKMKKYPRNRVKFERPPTEKQRNFAIEYLRLGHIGKAAIAAGYAPKHANEAGYQCFNVPSVRRMIEQGFEAKLGPRNILKNRVLEEMARIAFADLRDLVDVKGEAVAVKDSSAWSDDAAPAVAEVSQTVGASGGGSTKIKLHDKVRALEQLGKYLKLFSDTVEVTGGISIDATYSELQRLTSEERQARLDALRKKLTGG